MVEKFNSDDPQPGQSHPSYLSTYLREVGPWNRVVIREPVKIDGRFVVDCEVERRLLVWSHGGDGMFTRGGLSTKFEYRMPSS